MVKNLPANAGNAGLIPESGKSLEKEMATQLVFFLNELLYFKMIPFHFPLLKAQEFFLQYLL